MMAQEKNEQTLPTAKTLRENMIEQIAPKAAFFSNDEAHFTSAGLQISEIFVTGLKIPPSSYPGKTASQLIQRCGTSYRDSAAITIPL